MTSAIPVQRSNQLSYQASWLDSSQLAEVNVSSRGRVKDYDIKRFINIC